ncbi:MAG: endonuclease/exonuclease/phosphatase family protein [Flavobacteriales bacterium]
MFKLILKITFFIINIVAAVPMVLTLLASSISPADSWMIAASGLLFPLMVVVNFVFVIAWLLAKSYLVLLSASLLIISIPTISHTIQIDFGGEENKKGLRVMTFNLRGSDYYSYIAKQGVIRDSICHLIDDEDVDVLCTQEFFSSEAKKFDVLKQLVNGKKKKYFYVNEMGEWYNDYRWGLVTFSVYPIVNKKSFYFDPQYPFATYCDLKINNDTIRVFNVHLRSFRFSHEERKVFDIVLDSNDIPSAEQSMNILKRFEVAYNEKAREIDTLAKVIKRSPHRVVVCGDFNDPASSYAYHELSEKLEDAFVESGSGYGKTFNGNLPLLRIDYILHDEKISSFNYKTIYRNLADHYPVVVDMELIK